MTRAGARSTRVKNCSESAGLVLRYFKDADLRSPSGFGAVGNAEAVAMAAHLDQPNRDRGQHSQMSRYVFGVFVRIDEGLRNLHFVSGLFEDERCGRGGIEMSDDSGGYALHGAADIPRMAFVDGKSG